MWFYAPHVASYYLKVKKKLDSMDLLLKNLQFEEIYLQREITKCLNYK